MSKKEEIIQKIEKFDEKYFNEDQKNIAIKIIKMVNEKEVEAFADFIFYKRKVGFGFDYSPEIAKGRLITLKENINKRINVNDNILQDENKLIVGDNYNALKSLLLTHKSKIDIIYIDPPYNTEAAKYDGNQSSKDIENSSKFIYKDKFGRCGWLNMMKQRLELAKNLLSDDGVIFISIDDNEQAYLKILMDEIFGEENFIGNIIWQSNNSIMKNVKFIKNGDFEYILIFSKNKSKVNEFTKRNNFSLKFSNIDNDKNGNWISTNATYKNNKHSKNYFPIKLPNGNFIEKTWRFSKEEYDSKKINLFFNDNNIPRLKIYEKDYNMQNKSNPSIYLSFPTYANNNEEIKIYVNKLENFILNTETFVNGKNQLLQLSIENFDTPKPIQLIKNLLKLIENKNSTILDFFAGSGTTGHAVLDLNREDGGTRKFILVTNNENNIAYDVTYERLYRIINGKGTKSEEFKWLEKNKPFSDTKLRVIDIDDSINISVDENIDEKIYNNALNGLKLLNNTYNKKDLELFYDLAALNPLEKNCEIK